ncbi:3-deoxy-D-manno-octulosonic acid kinase [Psychromonas sp. KJ10-10]|uniref:3-deoxy-D-manno-octulosonic acid kinase n=1 Tax=Psychromonas sp. KJ10-10 TaxID=3391823 RepID=UPI0039B668DD
MVFSASTKKYVLRHYYRGGLIGKVNSDNFLFQGLKQTRAYQEFELLDKMNSLGLPVPIPYAGKISCSTVFYKADLIIELIEGAQDLVAILTKQAVHESRWREIGRVIRLFHDHNIYHSDMNSHNIMIDTSDKVWLIDFDKCAQRESGPWKEQTLARLLRSFRKEKTINNKLNWDEANWTTLMQGYQEH